MSEATKQQIEDRIAELTNREFTTCREIIHDFLADQPDLLQASAV